MEQSSILLKEIGLTEYETKSFLTLLQLGIATAEQISETAGIPLPRVYDTLVELQKKGFVLISKGRPKKFKPNSPKRAFKNFIESKKNEQEKEIKYLKATVKNLENILSKVETIKIREADWGLWSIEKRRNIGSILDEQKEMSKKEILIFSGDLSWLGEAMKIIKQAIRKGVKIKTIVHEPENEELKKNIKMAKKIGMKVKSGYKGLMRGHIIDNKIVSIAIKQTEKGLNIVGQGRPGSDSLDRYELMTSDNPILVKTLRENFDFWWKSL